MGTDEDDDEPQWLVQPAGLRDRGDERRLLERLLQLARAAMPQESKLAALRRFLSKVDEPAIVFTEYRDTLQRLADALSPLDAVQLHGGLSPRERADVTHRFTRGNVRLLLATDAGSEGLNLHDRCRLVINLELPWTPLRLEQRIGRVDRIGQHRQVHAVHLVAAGTCEETTLARLVERMKRMHGAMSLLARVADGVRVAESILGRQTQPEALDDQTVLPPALRASKSAPGVVALDLGREAQAEAARIGQARALSRGRHPAVVIERPVITRIRSRRHTTRARCLWMFRAVFATAGSRLVWEALVPLDGHAVALARRSAVPLRTLLNPEHPLVQQALARGCDLQLRHLQRSLDDALNCWTGRERDIAAVLRGRHARLSAGLLQRGLFDRRAERHLAAQSSLLDQALSKSSSRLNDLARCRDVRLDTSELVCAVLLE